MQLTYSPFNLAQIYHYKSTLQSRF